MQYQIESMKQQFEYENKKLRENYEKKYIECEEIEKQ
jgi:hypothetical protein